MILFAGQQRINRYKKQIYGHGFRREGVGWLERVILKRALTYVKWIAGGNLLYDPGNPKLVLCDNIEEGNGEGGERVFVGAYV